MSYSKPFHRNYRQIKKGPNSGYSNWGYIIEKDYAQEPEHYIRAFLIIQKDLKNLFEYIEPSDINLNTYSYRIHELLMRTCIEIEANFKAILRENIYNPIDQKGKPIHERNWTIKNYKLINKTHHLSSYKVIIPQWKGVKKEITPFSEWATNNSLTWYQAYNSCKHDRHEEFVKANFENLLNAITGLLILLSSQFNTIEFSPKDEIYTSGSIYDGENAIGDFFRIKFPTDWNGNEKYDFDWSTLKKEEYRFEKIDYNEIERNI